MTTDDKDNDDDENVGMEYLKKIQHDFATHTIEFLNFTRDMRDCHSMQADMAVDCSLTSHDAASKSDGYKQKKML
jgi:hypothetical protein